MNSDFLAAGQTLENIKFLNAGSFASSGCKIFRHPAGRMLPTGPFAMRCATPPSDLSIRENHAGVTSRRIHASMA
jgi:hypothetical protein